MSYLTTPYVGFQGSADPAFALLAAASSGVVRVLVDGDSTVTSPGGMGVNYYPLMISEWAMRFHNTPETQLWPSIGSYVESCVPFMASPNSWSNATRIPANACPPGITPVLLNFNYPTQAVQIGLRHDGQMFTNPDFSGLTHFNLGTSIEVEILCGTYNGANGDGLTWEIHSVTDPTTLTGGTLVATGTIAAATLQSATFKTVSTVVSCAVTAGNYYNIYLYRAGVDYSSQTAVGVDLIGVRWRSTANRSGFVFQPIAAGGLKQSDLLATYPNCGTILGALGAGAVMLKCGANDASAAVSAATFGTNTAAKIAFYRSLYPGAEIVLIACPFNSLAAPGGPQDSYADQLYTLATTTANCKFINLRRIVEEQGFNAVSDGLSGGNPPAGAAAYNASTVYTAGQIVSVTDEEDNPNVGTQFLRFYKARTGGAPAGAYPFTSPQYWQPINRHMLDNVHHTFPAMRMIVSAEVSHMAPMVSSPAVVTVAGGGTYVEPVVGGVIRVADGGTAYGPASATAGTATLPAIANVLAGTGTYGVGGTSRTPTLPVAKVMAANGGNIPTSDVRNDTATGIAAGGTLSITADNPPASDVMARSGGNILPTSVEARTPDGAAAGGTLESKVWAPGVWPTIYPEPG